MPLRVVIPAGCVYRVLVLVGEGYAWCERNGVITCLSARVQLRGLCLCYCWSPDFASMLVIVPVASNPSTQFYVLCLHLTPCVW